MDRTEPIDRSGLSRPAPPRSKTGETRAWALRRR